MSGPGLHDIHTRTTAMAILLLVATALSYATSLWNGFVLDDHQIIEHNQIVTDVKLGQTFTTPYQGSDTSDALYRPLTVSTLALQWGIHGGMAWAYHLVNAILHWLVSIAVWFLATAITRERGLAGAIAALLFAVHPIHTDAVSNIVNRSEVLAGGFAILGFLAWSRWLIGATHSWLAGAALAFFAGMLSKESAGPLALLALVWALPNSNRTRSSSISALGFVLAFTLPVLAYLGLRWWALDGVLVAPGNRYFQHVALAPTIFTMLGVSARYFRLLIWPQTLSPDYTFESIPIETSLFGAWPLAGLVLVVGYAAIAALLFSRRSGRAAGWGMVWFAVFMLTATNIIPLLVPMAERLTYVASAGICISMGVGAAGAIRRSRILAAIVVAIVLAVFTGMSAERNRVWQNDLTLTSDAVTTFPENALMLANLGGALATNGEPGAAVAAFQRAIDKVPAKWEFRIPLANLLSDLGGHPDELKVLLDGLAWARGVPEYRKRTCEALKANKPDTDLLVCDRAIISGLDISSP